MVAAGADVNVKSKAANCRGITPLLFVAEQGAADGATALMRTLIEAKADQTLLWTGRTAIELMLDKARLENGNVGHSLLVSGLDLSTRNPV